MKSKVIMWWERQGGKPDDLLNDWLTENSDKQIINITQSESGDTTESHRITYTIFYKGAK